MLWFSWISWITGQALVVLRNTPKTNKGRKRILLPIDEFFLILVRLCLGLAEQDLAYRFGISQPIVSSIFNTWINLLYLQFKQMKLWPPKALISANMPAVFKDKYPSTRVIIDATEIFVDQPCVPELQQLTFSSYKNHNTFKGLIRIVQLHLYLIYTLVAYLIRN